LSSQPVVNHAAVEFLFFSKAFVWLASLNYSSKDSGPSGLYFVGSKQQLSATHHDASDGRWQVLGINESVKWNQLIEDKCIILPRLVRRNGLIMTIYCQLEVSGGRKQ
jgi:hypothetical protein